MRCAAGFLVFVAALAVTPAFVGVAKAQRTQEVRSPEEWRAFAGSWSATGERHTLQTEGARAAAVMRLSGAVVLTQATGLSIGFLSEMIGFDDGRNVSVGRAVWTDAHGNRVFSELNGDPLETGRRILGRLTGGTGRYAGIVGDYELTWQYFVQGEGDTVQGRAVDLKGRFRLSEASR